MAGPGIRPLSPGVRSYLRTGVALSSITQCMEELVLNSVDAGATCVAVRIDLSCFKIQVVDNGSGMTQSQLELVGQRYHTSKCHSMEDLGQLCHYGYRGEAIASLTDACSILEITSRTKHLTPTFCKIFNKGRSMKVVQSSVTRPSAGTTITAHDLFYNMPVRKKAINPVLEFERVKKRLEAISLMRPAISFSLRNDITGHVVLQTHKTSGVLNVFTSLFGMGRSKTLSAIQGQTGCFIVEGYIGKEGFSKKDLQFVYINKRLVLKTKIHKVINFLLGKSLILRKKGVLDKQGESKQQESVLSLTSSPTKYSEKFGVFVVNISCPYTEYDVTFDPAKTLVEFKDWDTLCTCIEGAVSEFLKRECLLLGIQEIMAEDRAVSGEKSGDTAERETSADGDQVSISENITVPVEEQISTNNNRNFLTSKLVKRPPKQENKTMLFDDENLTDTSKGLDAMETQEKVKCLEKNNDSNLIQNKQSMRNYEYMSEKEIKSGISETVSSCEGTSVTDHTNISSTDSLRGRKKCSDQKCSDSDERDGEGTDRFDEDEDYESEDPVPKFDWKFREKGKELINECEKQQTRIRLKTPHIGCNGGSTLSLIKKGHSLCDEEGKGNSLNSERISCYESIKKRLHCDKTSKGLAFQYGSDESQHNQMSRPTKSSDLSVSDSSHVNKTKEVVRHRRLGEKNNAKCYSDSSERNGENETGYRTSSQEDTHTFTHNLPQKRMSNLAESSVAAKLARLTRLQKKEVNISTGKALGSELEYRVPLSSSHKLGDSTTNTSSNTAVSSSECHQEMVPSNVNRSGNYYKLFNHSWSVLCTDGVSDNRSVEYVKGCAITSPDSSRKMVDSSNVPKKFLTSASFVQTYNDLFQNCMVSKDLTHLDQCNHKDLESPSLGHGLSDSECKILSDKETEMEACLRSKKDTNDTGNTKVKLLIGSSGAHFQTIPSESQSDSMQDTILYEGAPKSVTTSDIDREDINSQDSSTDLLCYEEFDYSLTLQSNKESDRKNDQQCYQTSNNSKKLTLQDKTSTDRILPQYHQISDNHSRFQCEEKTKNLNTSPTLGDTEGKSGLTLESTESFVPCLASPEICSSNIATQGSDIPQSQGFVPISGVSSVMDKHIILDSVQESQGFVPVPAFTENRVISPAVSEGFSPVMMDDDLNVKLDNSSSNPGGSKRLCEDSDVTTVSSTNLGMETLAEYLDSYSSSIAELYEEDMSYVKTKKKKILRNSQLSPNTSSNVESSEHTKSPLSDVTHDNSLPGVSAVKSQNDLSDTPISTLNSEYSQLYDGKNSRAFVGNTGKNGVSSLQNDLNIEVSRITYTKAFPDTRNLDSLTSNEVFESIDSLDCGQQSVSQLEKSGYMSKNVQHVVMSDEEERCVHCETMQNSFCNSIDVVADSPEINKEGTSVFDSLTETTSNKLDTDNFPVTQSRMELFQNCHPIQDTDKSKPITKICFLGNRADRSLAESTLNITNVGCTTSSEKSKEFGAPELTSKQLKVLRESNRKGKLPMNIVDLCSKNQVKTADSLAKTDRSADIGQWSDVDEEDLVAVIEIGQTCIQQSQDLHNKTDITKDTCDCEQPWVEMEDPKTGEKLYVNSITGHNRPRDGSWEPPPPDMRTTTPDSTVPSMTNLMLNDLSPKSHNTLLHMMSEHLESMDKEEEDLLSVKWAGTRWSSKGTEDSQAADSEGTKCIEDLLENWDNPVFTRPEQTVAAAVETSKRPRGSARIPNVLHSHKFTKDMLHNVKVIGQVDNKFIACMTSSRMDNLAAAPNLMLLFDQHAAHERVRLEKLTKEAYDGDNRICCSTITPAKCLTLEEEEVRVMVSYREEFARIGVNFTTDKQERNSILVHTIPACIMQKEVNEVKRKRESIAWNIVLNLLKEHVEMLMSTSGVLGRLPATLHKVLCSQACHGAIKFGDQLSVEECKELLVSLSLCDLPFQCAHGRPSVMPLLELDKLELNHKTKKPNLWKISKQLQAS